MARDGLASQPSVCKTRHEIELRGFEMRQFLVLLIAVATFALVAAPAYAVQRHVHSLTTPGGTHEIAGGVSNHAPCTAFLNLHENVHVAVFLGGQFPNTVTVEFIEGTC
jgi:hypothetical protein